MAKASESTFWCACFILFFTLALGLSFPCGKHSFAFQGSCSSGNTFTRPTTLLVIGITITLPLLLIETLRTPHDGKWSNRQFAKSVLDQIRRWPKWRRKWYPVAFSVVYFPLALINHFLERQSGLYWYHSASRYILFLPFLSSLPAYWLLTKVRQHIRKK